MGAKVGQGDDATPTESPSTASLLAYTTQEDVRDTRAIDHMSRAQAKFFATSGDAVVESNLE